MRELLERLCALNAVSSWEDEVRAFLLAEVEPHADRLRVDALGNLIAWKKGRKHTGSKLLLTAHMDEVGLMIRQITDDGYLKFDRNEKIMKKKRLEMNYSDMLRQEITGTDWR